MRTIKFRGKNITTNKWVYGNLLYNALINKYFIIAMNDNNNLIEVNADTIGKISFIKGQSFLNLKAEKNQFLNFMWIQKK